MRLLFYLLIILPALSDSVITRGPYLQQSHSTGITVVWRSMGELTQPTVHYWQDGETVQKSTYVSMLGKTSLSKIPDGQWQFEATLHGLSPDTQYHYAIYDGEQALTAPKAQLSFRTHPLIGQVKPTRVWVVGDSGTGAQHQMDVHTAMQEYTTERPIDLYLHVGDMAYGQGTDVQFQERFFVPYQSTLQSTVCWASMGNHEGITSNGKSAVGPYYDAYVNPTRGEAGGVPSGTESYYSFDYGAAHFICLNSYDIDRSAQGEMGQWLQRDLAATQAQWIIGFWHHPPYTKGTHDSDSEKQLIEMREQIMPILEAGGVDLVLSGHSHIYERSMLIDGAYQTPTTAEGVVLDDGDGNPEGDGAYEKPNHERSHKGTVAIVTGHGGALGRNSKGVIPLMKSIVLDHGSTILDISEHTLDTVMIDRHGQERDRFQIHKKADVETSIVANPKVATDTTVERTGHGVLGSKSTLEAAAKAKNEGKTNIATQIPSKTLTLIAPNAEWDYLAHGQTPETEMWSQLGFDAAEEGWKRGIAGFGYGDDDDRTLLDDMREKPYTAVYIRREFTIPEDISLESLGLAINYDDGFSLHLNGHQVLSCGVIKHEDGRITVDAHEAQGHEYYSLSKFSQHLKPGKNVIAIEGHNTQNSSDFSLDPYLIVDLSKAK